MGYVDDNLMPGEQVTHRTRLHWTVFVSLKALLTLLLAPLVARATSEFAVTNRRVIQISGVLSKDVVDSSLEKVNDVKMSQSFLGRMFGFGDIEILTASELGVNLFHQIADPVEFKTAMLNAKERLGFEEIGQIAHAVEDIPSMIEKLDILRRRGVLSEAEFRERIETADW